MDEKDGKQHEPQEGSSGGAKGAPDPEAANKRLTEENAQLRTRAGELEKQIADLTESLGKALTEDDVKAAVTEAKAEAEKAAAEAQERWEADRLSLLVQNALISSGCTDTVGCMAHIDLDKVAVAPDGHLSGLDAKKLAKDLPHLFAQGANTQTVASAAAPGGPAKTMTREEIMAEPDPAKRRSLIAEHMDLFE